MTKGTTPLDIFSLSDLVGIQSNDIYTPEIPHENKHQYLNKVAIIPFYLNKK